MKREDHVMLLHLIRGHTLRETAVLMGLTRTSASSRLNRMKGFVGVKTVYQLIALEVINLMESDAALPVIEGTLVTVERVRELVG